MMRRLCLSGLLLVASACTPASPRVLAGGAQGADQPPAVIALKSPAGHTFQAEVMVRPADRARGLMFRPSLPEDRVLLFAFDDLGFHSIWMKNCEFPIDIVWLDETRKVVHVTEKAPPCRAAAEDCPSYAPMRSALYVIEMNAGQARREGYVVGAPVRFTLPR